MIGDYISNGAFVIMPPVANPSTLKEREIVAAWAKVEASPPSTCIAIQPTFHWLHPAQAIHLSLLIQMYVMWKSRGSYFGCFRGEDF